MSCLTADQIEAIQNTWKAVGGGYIDLGEAILIAFLEKYPHYLPIFADLKDKSIDELKGYYKLRHFASRVFNFVGMLVDTLDKDGIAAIKAMIIDLGDFHVKRGLTNKQAFGEIKEVCLTVMTDMYNLTEDEGAAWEKFLGLFIQIMFSVFDGNA